jgi:hypothetical protein
VVHDHGLSPPAELLGTEAMRLLRRRATCAVQPGLTDAEFARIEQDYGFRFADDHRAFLANGLPVHTRPEPQLAGVIKTYSDPWPDWRHGDPSTLRERLDWPTSGVLFDVLNNNHWYEGWGPRPPDPKSARALAEQLLTHVPTMVPVYGHRYLPAGRGTWGHPVLPIWQTDIIYYGLDLADYIDRGFGKPAPCWSEGKEPEATVDFWRDYV